jgi:hypothetical protein
MHHEERGWRGILRQRLTKVITRVTPETGCERPRACATVVGMTL